MNSTTSHQTNRMHNATNDYTDADKAQNRWDELRRMNEITTQKITQMQEDNKPLTTKEWLLLGGFTIAGGIAIWLYIFHCIA